MFFYKKNKKWPDHAKKEKKKKRERYENNYTAK